MTRPWQTPVGLRASLIALVVAVQALAMLGMLFAAWQLLGPVTPQSAPPELPTSLARLLSALGPTQPSPALSAGAERCVAEFHLQRLEITDTAGRVLARAERSTPAAIASAPDGRVALDLGGRPAGTASYWLARDLPTVDREHHIQRLAMIAGLALLLSALLIAVLTRGLSRRLQRLRDAGQRFAKGHLSTRIQDERQDELGELGRSFDRMAEQLAQQFKRLRAKDARLSLVIEGTSDGIWDWDLLANEVYFSPRFRKLLGYADEAEFRRGFFFSTALHPDDRDRVLSAQYAHLEHRTPFDEAYRLRCRDGNYRWFRGRGQARWNKDGKADRYAGSITDIEAQKQSEAARRESEERLYYAIRGSSDGIWDWNLRLDRYYMSPRYKQLLGYRDDELSNHRSQFLALIHPQDLERVETAVAEHFATRQTYDVTCRLRHKDGEYRWFRSRGEAVWNEAGEVVRFAGASSDITEQRQAQESIRALLAEKQAILDNVPVGIVFVDHQRIANANQRFSEWFATPERPIVGASLASFGVHEEAPPQRARELQLKRQDGEQRWFYVTSRPIKPEAPDAGALWIFADTTALKTTSAALRDAHDLSDAVIKSLPGVFFLLEASGRIVRWNRNLETVTATPPERMEDLIIRSLCHPDDRLNFQGALTQALRNTQATVEARLSTAEGKAAPHVFTIIKVDLHGVSHLVGVGVDISERQAAEREIRALNTALETRVRERTAELSAANDELESFSYSVSHDLSAPLRGIDGFSRMLEEDYRPQLDQNALDYLQRIRSATQRMQQLIDDLLKLSKVTRDQMRRASFNLTDLVRDIETELRDEYLEHPVSLTVPDTLPVRGDRNLLRIMMSNLMRNAWKFSTRNPSPAVTIGCLQQDGETVYFVQDNGAGFDMRYAGKLFCAFQRLHRDTDYPGTGIGLATVSRIVHRHGGRVWADAQVDRGASFFFTLG
ncbi:PAS domain-containing protein [Denitromonas iodatirespirans]|uniref:histidine kinase n=1 Tax=Denitromonas iodatirespirans TaxID=2795389 RepID=A0A944H6F9_DENI1|nr:PAS domain-containing protein [Denitromonas iodatirespirans]MBT0960144.1 PAS domain-containing protein [Denitromonas iodatirespirans]